MKPAIKIKRIYDEPLKNDGFRVLVGWLWPCGMKYTPVQVSREQHPSLMRLIFDHLEIPGFAHCSGTGSCGTCMVEIDDRYVLSCAEGINDELANKQIANSGSPR